MVAGLLNVKTADERCIRSVSCTTRSYGRRGKSDCGVPAGSSSFQPKYWVVSDSFLQLQLHLRQLSQKFRQNKKGEQIFSQEYVNFLRFGHYFHSWLVILNWADGLFSTQSCSPHGWGRTLKTESISTWKGRVTRKPARCLYEWWPVLTKLWKSNLAWSRGEFITCQTCWLLCV